MDDIKVTCINPACNDTKDHLWINIKKMVYHCWKCDFGGKVIDNKAIQRILKNRGPIKPTSTVSNSMDLIDTSEFVDIKTLKTDHAAIQYIKSREVSLDSCIQLGCMYAPSGVLSGRIVFPVRNNNAIVGWQGRSVYGRVPKYKIYGRKNAGMYNVKKLQDYKNFAIIFEGVFDVLKVPDHGISILGKKMSEPQLRMLSTFLNVKIVFIMLDSDANKEENVLAKQLSPYFKCIPIQLETGDPGDITEIEILTKCLSMKGKK